MYIFDIFLSMKIYNWQNLNNESFFFLDLLEGGKTTGESVRLLFTPHQRVQPKTETENEKAPTPEKEGAENQGTERSDDMRPDEKEIQLDRSWYNMVCYGLPNLMVAQV